jgi:hypothetical protein
LGETIDLEKEADKSTALKGVMTDSGDICESERRGCIGILSGELLAGEKCGRKKDLLQASVPENVAAGKVHGRLAERGKFSFPQESHSQL